MLILCNMIESMLILSILILSMSQIMLNLNMFESMLSMSMPESMVSLRPM